MAIEIRQLVIRAVVDAGARSDSPSERGVSAGLVGGGPQAAASKPRPSEAAIEPISMLGADERQAIVNACVREVLRKLERARER